MTSIGTTRGAPILAPVARPHQDSVLRFLLRELRPKGRILTPFNVITGVILVASAALLFVRFTRGLGSITNLTQDYPWGLWIGFDVLTGVAFAGGAYVVTFLVYILRIEQYHAIARVTVLNGFLAYLFYAGALLLDLGRPWNVVNPVIGNSFGVSSVLFLVAWHFMLYMLAELVEFSPAIAEWLGWERLRKMLAGATVATVIFGITLSSLHQSGVGALYLLAKGKVHPLWWSELIPILFVVSSVFAGLSLVMVEGTISHRVFSNQLPDGSHHRQDRIYIGLARICAGTMFVYLFLAVLAFVHGHNWVHLGTGMSLWYLLEVGGFVLVPCILFAYAIGAENRIGIIKAAAVLTLIGVLLNRLNVSIIAFKWYEPVRYYPAWGEIVVTLGVISAELWVVRWVINRMPVLRDQPAWALEAKAAGSTRSAA